MGPGAVKTPFTFSAYPAGTAGRLSARRAAFYGSWRIYGCLYALRGWMARRLYREMDWTLLDDSAPVSYTHLDVYKRQDHVEALRQKELELQRTIVKTREIRGEISKETAAALMADLDASEAKSCLLYTSRRV